MSRCRTTPLARALIIDAELPRAELLLRDEPLLPHFSFNIRCGDSLVQEIGEMNLAQIRAEFSGVPRPLKARVTRLKTEKLKFFNNDDTCRYRSTEELEHEELQLFLALVDTHAQYIKQEIDDLQQLIDGPKAQQMLLDGTVEARVAHQLELQATEWQKQIDALTQDHDRAIKARDALVREQGGFFCLGHRLCRNLHRRKGRIRYRHRQPAVCPTGKHRPSRNQRQKDVQSKTRPLRVSGFSALLRLPTPKGHQTRQSIRRRLSQTGCQKRSLHLLLLSRALPPQSERDFFASLPPIRGSMSTTVKTFRSSPSSTATSSRLSTTKCAAPSPPPM